jgi:hypothetical protein
MMIGPNRFSAEQQRTSKQSNRTSYFCQDVSPQDRFRSESLRGLQFARTREW